MAPHISRATWNGFKSIIEAFYVDQEKTLEETRLHMLAHHDFDATKEQYRTIFRTWGFEKNIRPHEWAVAAPMVRKRRAEGKDTQFVIDDNKIISVERVKRRMRRTEFSTDASAHASSDQTLAVVPLTPPSSDLTLTDFCFVPHAFTRSFAANLPFLQSWNAIMLKLTGQGPLLDSNPLKVTVEPSQGLINSKASLIKELVSGAVCRKFQLPTTLSELLAPPGAGSLSSQELVQNQPLLQFLQTALYVISNNLCDQDGIDRMVEWIDTNNCGNVLSAIVSTQTPSIEVFSAHLFTCAINQGNFNVSKTLLDTGVSWRSFRPSYVHCSARGLCPHWASTALCAAVRRKDWRMAKLLLKFGADPNDSETETLKQFAESLLAALSDNCTAEDPLIITLTDLMMRLIDRCANAKRFGSSTLEAILAKSCKLNFHTLRETLTSIGVIIRDPKPETTRGFQWISPPGSQSDVKPYYASHKLCEAVLGGNIDSVHKIIKQRKVTKESSCFGHNPLLIAVHRGNFRIVQELLKLGADPNQSLDSDCPYCDDLDRDDLPTHPLHLAVAKSNHKLVQTLLQHKADASLRDDHGRTPLEYLLYESSNNGNISMARYLLENGADVNAKREFDGLTMIEMCLPPENFDLSGQGWVTLLWEYGSQDPWLICLEKGLLKVWINESKWHRGTSQEKHEEFHDFIHFWRGIFERHSEGTGASKTQFVAWLNSGLDFAIFGHHLDLVWYFLEEHSDSRHLRGFRYDYIRSNIRGEEQKRAAHRRRLILDHALERGITIDGERDDSKIIPFLQVAILDEDTDMIRTLLSRGASVTDFPQPGGFSPLHLATSRENETASGEAIEMLVAHHADKDGYEQIYTLDSDTKKRDEADEMRSIFCRYADNLSDRMPEIRRRTGMALMEAKLRVYGFHATPLQAACFYSNQTAVNILRGLRADINAPAADEMGFTALQIAVARGEVSIVRYLLEAGADLNAPPAKKVGFTALQCAILTRRNWELLINMGADVDDPAASEIGCTALQAAVMVEDERLVSFLLAPGAAAARVDVNAPAASDYGRTALQAACFNGNQAIFEALIKRRADVNAPPCRCGGATALQLAAMRGNIDMVAQLIELNAQIDAPGAVENGRTALEVAAEHGHLDVVRLLLQEHPRPLSLDEECMKAAKLAKRERHDVVANLLRGWNDPSSKYSPFYSRHEA